MLCRLMTCHDYIVVHILLILFCIYDNSSYKIPSFPRLHISYLIIISLAHVLICSLPTLRYMCLRCNTFYILFCSVLLYYAQFCSALFCSVLLWSVLFCSVLLCSVLFCFVSMVYSDFDTGHLITEIVYAQFKRICIFNRGFKHQKLATFLLCLQLHTTEVFGGLKLGITNVIKEMGTKIDECILCVVKLNINKLSNSKVEAVLF